MTILCLGSVNIDHVYRVSHLPGPGETLACKGHAVHLGGKGANMSLAAALSGGQVSHAGAIGPDGRWCRERLAAVGVGVEDLVEAEESTGHATILVDDAGENAIVIHGGANRTLTRSLIDQALARRARGDWLLIQNETNMAPEAAKAARAAGLKVAYAAAPFDRVTVTDILPHVDLLAVNAVEARQLAEHLGVVPEAIPIPAVLVTEGADGARYRDGAGEIRMPAFDVTPVDTTGAGDTFLGVFLATLDGGAAPEAALERAAAAAAIQVTREGAAASIPTAEDIERIRSDQRNAPRARLDAPPGIGEKPGASLRPPRARKPAPGRR